MRIKIVLLLMTAALISGAAQAGTTTLSGFVNDPANTALVGSDLGSPLFGDDYDIANNVALYQLKVLTAGDVLFQSLGFGAGGIDPYFTLFTGTGDSAAFLGSNFDQAFSTGGDFDLTFTLGAGDYTVAVGVFANMSFAENNGTSTLSDGFIGLGEPYVLGDCYYELAVTTPEATVPEPSALLLLSLSGLALVCLKHLAS